MVPQPQQGMLLRPQGMLLRHKGPMLVRADNQHALVRDSAKLVHERLHDKSLPPDRETTSRREGQHGTLALSRCQALPFGALKSFHQCRLLRLVRLQSARRL